MMTKQARLDVRSISNRVNFATVVSLSYILTAILAAFAVKAMLLEINIIIN